MQFTIDASQLGATIMKELSAFAGATNEIVDHAATTAAKHAVIELNTNSPSLEGRYAKGWKVKVDRRAKHTGFGRVTVHNKTDWQLTHLLEYGHKLVYYGHRTNRRVNPKVHIEPVRKEAYAEFEALIKMGVGK